MKQTLARKYEHQFGCNAIDIETVTVQKNQDYENERTYWIFEDESALSLDSSNVVRVHNSYGLNEDYEKLR